MKRIFLFLLGILFACNLTHAQDMASGPGASNTSVTDKIGELLSDAVKAYAAGDYTKAADEYEKIPDPLKSSSPDIYYNLGNCYYKMGRFPKAILNYERCRSLNPSHVDAEVNLKLAQSSCYNADSLKVLQPSIFVQWNNTVRDSFTSDGWSRMSIALFIFFIAGMALFFFTRKRALRKTGFYGGILMIILCFVCMAYASSQAERRLAKDDAIIMEKAKITSEPKADGDQIVVASSGLRVHIRREQDAMSEIELPDGSVGWMPTKQLERIWPK